MGFAFPREEREALVASEPDKFLMPRLSEMRYGWVCVRLDAIDVEELRELLVDAWRMCVPKKVAAAHATSYPRASRSGSGEAPSVASLTNGHTNAGGRLPPRPRPPIR